MCFNFETIRYFLKFQLLKALFGTNLSSQWELPQSLNSSRLRHGKGSRLSTNMKPGLYHCCFTHPYTQFTQSLAGAAFKSGQADQDDSSKWVTLFFSIYQSIIFLFFFNVIFIQFLKFFFNVINPFMHLYNVIPSISCVKSVEIHTHTHIFTNGLGDQGFNPRTSHIY